MTGSSSAEAPASRPSRADLANRYRRNRERSRRLFALVSDEAYYSRPIALRHLVVCTRSAGALDGPAASDTNDLVPAGS